MDAFKFVFFVAIVDFDSDSDADDIGTSIDDSLFVRLADAEAGKFGDVLSFLVCSSGKGPSSAGCPTMVD